MRTLAVIPARAGSKRIPRKNIKPFLGVPLLTRTIDILAAAGVFDRIIVSTDDEEIEAVARSAGAEVPFRRPAGLSDDFAPTIEVIAHAIREVERGGDVFEQVFCVYPAAVLSQPGDYREALALLADSGADYVFAAAAFPYPVQRALRRQSDGSCAMLWPEHRDTRSQDLEAAFHDAGQFYGGRRTAWLGRSPIFARHSRMLVLPRHRVQDIDTFEDWRHAEQLYELNNRTTSIEPR